MGKCSLFLFLLIWYVIIFIYIIVLNYNIVIEKVIYKNDECGFKIIGCVYLKFCKGFINFVFGEMFFFLIFLKKY